MAWPSLRDRLLVGCERVGSGCWEWTRSIRGNGYGAIRVRGLRKFTHRTSWEIFNGPIPEGMCVCHRCDNRLCVNPAHLFLGTISDNVTDAMHKGRMASGERHGSKTCPAAIKRGEQRRSSRHTEAEIVEIRRLKREGLSNRQIAKVFAISHGAVWNIVTRKTWAHVE